MSPEDLKATKTPHVLLHVPYMRRILVAKPGQLPPLYNYVGNDVFAVNGKVRTTVLIPLGSVYFERVAPPHMDRVRKLINREPDQWEYNLEGLTGYTRMCVNREGGKGGMMEIGAVIETPEQIASLMTDLGDNAPVIQAPDPYSST